MINKIYTFKVSAEKKIYRTIEVRGNSTLSDFAAIILESFDFDMDHCFGFYDNYKDLFNSKEVYELFADLEDCEASDGALGVEKVKVQDVFAPKKKMAFLFDYGDEWIFLIECKDISDPTPKRRYPKITEKVGIAPEQYPVYEEDDE